MDFSRCVPPRLLELRPMESRDAPRISEWIAAGRREGAFRDGSLLTPASLLEYQDRIRTSGWTYSCHVVEDHGMPVGYLDYRSREGLGELMGIFLQPDLRGFRFGRHLMRWVANALRQEGCSAVTTEVYADNMASLEACRQAGFEREESQDRREDGKIILTLGRRLAPLWRLSSPDPSYTHLKGKNIYLHHAAVAEALSEQMRTIDGIELILGLGSLARGFGDYWSDVDLAVLGRGTGLDDLWRGERQFAGLTVDLFAVDLDASPSETWNESRRQAFEESVVLFTADDSLPDFIQEAVHLKETERVHKVREVLLEIGWLGFAPRCWANQLKYGYLWSLPPDLWLRRGSTVSAHATINGVLDLTLKLLFLTNARRIPDFKWRRYLVTSLPWVPTNFGSLLERVERTDNSETAFRGRADALLSIIEAIVEKLEETGSLEANLYEKFLQVSDDYDPRA